MARGRVTEHPKETETFLRALATNATKNKAGTRWLCRCPIELNLQLRTANETAPPGRARARGRALVSLRLFIYCCADKRARRVCDACVVNYFEYGVRRGLSVDCERDERLLGGLAESEAGVAGARHESTAAAGAAAAAAAAGARPAGLLADDAPLAARADGSGPSSWPSQIRQSASYINLGPLGEWVQAGWLPGSESGGFYHTRGHYAMPSASIWTVSEAFSWGIAHSVHKT